MSEATNGDLRGREVLLQRLAALGIDAEIVAYPEHTTIEEGKRLRGDLDGVFTKNLLLKDKKRRLFLVAADEDNDVDLKSLHTRVGARGRLGFASAEEMRRVLGVDPGTLTPLAVINDTSSEVTVVLDQTLNDAEQINFHPMVHTESIGLNVEQLRTFLDSCSHPLMMAALS